LTSSFDRPTVFGMTDPKKPEVQNPDEPSDDELRKIIAYEEVPKDKVGNFTRKPIMAPEDVPQFIVEMKRAELPVDKLIADAEKRLEADPDADGPHNTCCGDL